MKTTVIKESKKIQIIGELEDNFRLVNKLLTSLDEIADFYDYTFPDMEEGDDAEVLQALIPVIHKKLHEYASHDNFKDNELIPTDPESESELEFEKMYCDGARIILDLISTVVLDADDDEYISPLLDILNYFTKYQIFFYAQAAHLTTTYGIANEDDHAVDKVNSSEAPIGNLHARFQGISREIYLTKRFLEKLNY